MDSMMINDTIWDSYEALLRSGRIEIYEYDTLHPEVKRKFIEKWKEQRGTDFETELKKWETSPEEADEEPDTIYIGQAGKAGKFYECYEDFFLRHENEKESDHERLIKEILAEIKKGE